MDANQADALVLFGATGDLAFRKIYPALKEMMRHGHLKAPVIGVARAGWDLERFRALVRHALPDVTMRAAASSGVSRGT